QGLEAVADAEDQLFRVAELAQRVAEEMAELVGQDFARSHIVAVGEAAGNDQDLVTQELAGAFAQAVDVQPFGLGAGFLESELRLPVAIGAGAAKDEDAGSGHFDPEKGEETA